jgi:hypothetical protein
MAKGSGMMDLFEHIVLAGGIGLVGAMMCVFIFHEVLGHVWIALLKLEGRPRLQIFITMLACFFSHTLCIWLFAGIYYMMENWLHLGALHGVHAQSLIGYAHFSSATYSSLGFGDLYPTGPLQMIASIEVILGLMLIGWSVAFTYLVTDKYLVHKRNRHQSQKKDSV